MLILEGLCVVLLALAMITNSGGAFHLVFQNLNVLKKWSIFINFLLCFLMREIITNIS